MNKNIKEGIILREIRRSDLPIINLARNDREFMKLLNGQRFPITIAQDENWFNNIGKDSSRLIFAIEYQNQFVGYLNAVEIDYINQNCFYGCSIFSNFQGKGIAVPATKEFFHYLFTRLNIKRVFCKIISTNINSQKYVEKCGMIKAGIMHKAIYDSEFIDAFIYEIDIEELFNKKDDI